MIGKLLLISGGNLVRQGLTFLSQMILARVLGQTVFGHLTLAFSIYLVMAGSADLGTRLYSWRRVAMAEEGDRDREAARLVWMRWKLALFVACLLNLGIFLWADPTVAALLHLYTGAVLVNQATFDWVFLARSRYAANFGFTSAVGVIYITGILILVRGPRDAELVPVILVLACALAGLTFLYLDDRHLLTRTRLIGGRLRETWGVVRSNWYLTVYDLLQRTYSVAIILVASAFYTAAAVAEFRVPHLVYGLVAGLGVHVASSVFNRVARESRRSLDPVTVSHGLLLIIAVFIPAGIVGDRALAPAISLMLGPGYERYGPALNILVAFMAPAAMANYAREISVSSGRNRLAAGSYLVSTAVVVGTMLAHHPPSVAYMAYVLVAGEFAGLAVLILYRPRMFLTRITIGAAALSLLAGLALQASWDMLSGLLGGGWVGYATATGTVALAGGAYVWGVLTAGRRGRGDVRT